MDDLPGDLLDNILFKTDLRALAMMCCTNKSLQSHIRNPYFESKYFYLIESGLLHISSFGSYHLGYSYPHGGFRSLKIKDTLKESYIMGSCSGLLLLFLGGSLCLVNPLTKKFRFLDSNNIRREFIGPRNRKQLGLAVNQIDRTTQSFKIVFMSEVKNPYVTRYWFQINDGKSWRSWKVPTIACRPSDLDHGMKTPVYLDGSLHWLRNDGSIIVFNPETEKARLIPIKFPEGFCKPFFAASADRLTLISAKEKVIYVYALENVFSDPKWVLVEKIQNGVMDENWYVEAYDGKSLVLREERKEKGDDRVVHVYDLRAKKWVVMGPVPGFCDSNQDFFHFTPSPSSVVGLGEILACDDKRLSSLSSIMALIDGNLSEEVEEKWEELWFEDLMQIYLLNESDGFSPI